MSEWAANRPVCDGADDAFLRFLEHLDDQGRAEREQKQLVDRANAVDVEPEPKSKPA